jgi:hypothetical protein
MTKGERVRSSTMMRMVNSHDSLRVSAVMEIERHLESPSSPLTRICLTDTLSARLPEALYLDVTGPRSSERHRKEARMLIRHASSPRSTELSWLMDVRTNNLDKG